MFAAMPETTPLSSLNRRGPSRRASTRRRLHRSPTRSRAAASGEAWVAGARVEEGSCIPGMVAPEGCAARLAVVTCKSLLTSPHLGASTRMSVLEELQTAVASVAQQVGPAVVGIGRRQRGSGVVVAAGRVLTNAHNLRGGETTVRFADGRTATGRVAGVDWDGDLAVVEVETTGATPLAFGDGQP